MQHAASSAFVPALSPENGWGGEGDGGTVGGVSAPSGCGWRAAAAAVREWSGPRQEEACDARRSIIMRLRRHRCRLCHVLSSSLIFSSSGVPDLPPDETVVVVVVVAVVAWRVLWRKAFVRWASMSCSTSFPGYVRLSDYRLAPRWHFFGGISSR